jgi:hypothetical protein
VKDALVARASAARRESRQIEFKESFDAASRPDWCEIIKDVIAIANSGGGIIVFGANSRGEPSGGDLSALSKVDPATIVDRVHPYTSTHATDIEVVEVERQAQKLIGWVVAPSPVPIVFVQPGTIPIEGGKQKAVFSRGTVYFRHGAKSEPGTTEDIAQAMERKLESVRREWLAGVRKVVEAPEGSRISLLPPEVQQSSSPDAAPIRITDDAAAPAYRVVDPDSTHPFRQKELMAEVRRRLPEGIGFNSFDVVSLRRAHSIDEKRDFSYKPKFGSRQYSQAFADWLVAQVEADPKFFEAARGKHHETDV